MTSLERKALQIALGVLRSNTDYADFLNFWLQDYGRQVLSPSPPPPLLPELSAEEERMLVVRDVRRMFTKRVEGQDTKPVQSGKTLSPEASDSLRPVKSNLKRENCP